MKWTDSRDIAIELCDKFPELTQKLCFTDLHQWITELENLTMNPIDQMKILEAIILCWMDEMD